MRRGITIIGSGRHLPGDPVPNAALSRVMETNDAWIRQRTGIEQRHFASPGEGASDLAAEAARKALASAKIEASEVDYIVFATMTPDYLFPGSGGLLGAKLGIPGVPALDIRQQCAAIPFALQVANGLVASGAARTVLLVGAETHAGFMPWSDWEALRSRAPASDTDDAHGQEAAAQTASGRSAVDEAAWERATRHRGMAILFGDGAGAFVLRAAEEPGHGFLGAKIHSDGSLYQQIYIEGGGFRHHPYMSQELLARDAHVPSMQGRELFKHAVTKLPLVVRTLLEEQGVAIEEVDWFLAHQANDRINQAVRDSLRVDAAKVPSNIARYGNTSGATIPILTDELLQSGAIQKGQLLCFLALGSGLHWGACLMRL